MLDLIRHFSLPQKPIDSVPVLQLSLYSSWRNSLSFWLWPLPSRHPPPPLLHNLPGLASTPLFPTATNVKAARIGTTITAEASSSEPVTTASDTVPIDTPPVESTRVSTETPCRPITTTAPTGNGLCASDSTHPDEET